jgi:integrase
MRTKITTRNLGAQRGAFILWDTEIKGFHARRRTDDGKVTFGFRFTEIDGTKREIKLGIAGAVTVEDARAAAAIQAGKIAKGENPAAERAAARAVKTLSEVWTDYEKHALPKRRARVQGNYRSIWTNHIEPVLGADKVNVITPAMVEALHTAITDKAKNRTLISFPKPARGGRQKKPRWSKREGGKVIANRTLQLLSLLLNRAKVSPNPCTGVERHGEIAREVWYSDGELDLIVNALALEDLATQIKFWLFLETPIRGGNIQAAEWHEFFELDGLAPRWTIQGDKMKGKRPYTAYISAATGQLILQWRARMHNQSPRFMFPAAAAKFAPRGEARPVDPDRHCGPIKHDWKRLRARALDLAAPGVNVAALATGTPHLFKHTYLTRIAKLGANAPIIQAAGDHADIRTSMRYVHRADTALADLAARAAAQLPKASAA